MLKRAWQSKPTQKWFVRMSSIESHSKAMDFLLQPAVFCFLVNSWSHWTPLQGVSACIECRVIELATLLACSLSPSLQQSSSWENLLKSISTANLRHGYLNGVISSPLDGLPLWQENDLKLFRLWHGTFGTCYDIHAKWSHCGTFQWPSKESTSFSWEGLFVTLFWLVSLWLDPHLMALSNVRCCDVMSFLRLLYPKFTCSSSPFGQRNIK